MREIKNKSYLRKFDSEDVAFFQKLFAENNVDKRDADILARATDAINHFSGNALAQLILARTGEVFVENLPVTTASYRQQFIRGLEQIPIGELEAKSQIAAQEYVFIQGKAMSGNWNSLTFLRDLMDSCLKYTNIVYDYATNPVFRK